MSYLFKRQMAALLLALAGAGVLTSAAAAEFDGMLDVGAGKLHVVQGGSGPYTVVFEAGFGSDLGVWRKVAPQVAKNARVVMYSRAGTGNSPARTAPLGPGQSSAELARLLAQAKAAPPYILVGHSYGGFVIRQFAAAHPEQVAGMVFVDPADEGLELALKRVDAARVARDQRAMAGFVPPRYAADLKLVQQILDEGKLPAMAALPDVAAVLLTSVKARDGAEFFQETPAAVRIKRERHQAFFSQFSNGAHVVTANSGHNIHLQQPELVIGAIGQVIDAAAQAAERRAQQLARQALMAELEKAAALLGARQGAGAGALVVAALKQSRLGESDINTLGFDVINKGKQPVLAELILKYNAQAFAQSANAADSHGEALLGLRRAAEARQQFERALALARAGGAGERALAAYQSNLDKAEKALRQP
ncbi:alpha/beta fold hydrolase [Massilia glaciei]|uniref:Alpha/beta hydrolase n=1 Tax=Massilia glaciei TaxID=1524097 RepID=A0A2U2HNL8_9BURK|nr:alpha/beta hydrolase [Massilia glaciei]PWF49097.1 alpha/beta hydrolase [Massilia glaciei]